MRGYEGWIDCVARQDDDLFGRHRVSFLAAFCSFREGRQWDEDDFLKMTLSTQRPEEQSDSTVWCAMTDQLLLDPSLALLERKRCREAIATCTRLSAINKL